MARYENPAYDSGNDWSRGFKNLGTALYGDPAAAEDQALAASREAMTTKTMEEVNRGLRADKELQMLGDLAQSLFKNPDGSPLSLEQIQSAYTQLLPSLIRSGYDTKSFGNILTQGGALTGNDFIARPTFVAGGNTPGENFTVNPIIAERMSLDPITVKEGENVHIPQTVYPENSMAYAVNPPGPQPGATAGTAAAAQPVAATPSATAALPPPDIKTIIDTTAAKYNIPPELMYEVASIESNFDPNAVGDKYLEGGPSLGLWQFRPATAQGYGLNDPRDVATSTDAAGRMLSDLYRQFGSWDKAIAAYNWGSGNLTDFGMENMPASTRGYVARVMARLGQGGGGVAAATGAAPMSSVYTDGTGGTVISGQPKQTALNPNQTLFDSTGRQIAATGPAPETVTTSPGENVTRVSPTGEATTVYEHAPAPEMVTTTQGQTVTSVSPTGETKTVYAHPADPIVHNTPAGNVTSIISPDGSGATPVISAPFAPDQMNDADGGGAGKRIDPPDVKASEAMRLGVAGNLLVPPKYTTQFYHDLGPEANVALQQVINNAWIESGGNQEVAVAAGAKWVDDHFDIAFTPWSDTWWPGDEVAESFNVKKTAPFDPVPAPAAPAPAPTAAPAATAAPATTAIPPMPTNAADRQVGQVYNTPKFGPMRWAGDGWEEP